MPKFETLPGERNASIISSIINLVCPQCGGSMMEFQCNGKMPKKLACLNGSGRTLQPRGRTCRRSQTRDGKTKTVSAAEFRLAKELTHDLQLVVKSVRHAQFCRLIRISVRVVTCLLAPSSKGRIAMVCHSISQSHCQSATLAGTGLTQRTFSVRFIPLVAVAGGEIYSQIPLK